MPSPRQPAPDKTKTKTRLQLGLGGPLLGHLYRHVPCCIAAVNDPPVVFAPPYMYTDEDTPMVGLNLTISDVDTYDGIGVCQADPVPGSCARNAA